MTFDGEIRSARLRRAMRRAPDQLFDRMRTAMSNSIHAFAGRFQTERLNHPKDQPPRPAGGGLRRVTGTLSRSFTERVEGNSLDTLAVRYSSTGVRYARPHELGNSRQGLPPRMGLFALWDGHIDTDMMPRAARAVDAALRDVGL